MFISFSRQARLSFSTYNSNQTRKSALELDTSIKMKDKGINETTDQLQPVVSRIELDTELNLFLIFQAGFLARHRLGMRKYPSHPSMYSIKQKSHTKT